MKKTNTKRVTLKVKTGTKAGVISKIERVLRFNGDTIIGGDI